MEKEIVLDNDFEKNIIFFKSIKE